ncbi:MAG: glycosyl transferase [Odoribacter sp.]|nr:glycosyl transferase [Odoribacter sp.]
MNKALREAARKSLYLLAWMPDSAYLKLMYRAKMGKKLNLKNPQTFNEKIQWLKLHDRKPEYTQMVDKCEAKKYVSNIIGEEYIIPTLGVWDKFEDIDFDRLPEQFVLKCTHDSGGLVIVKDKSKMDVAAAREIINKSLKHNFYYYGREWPYKNVKPRIIAEKYMVYKSGFDLKDYKFFCFDGFAKAMFIASDRNVEGEDTKFDFYDMEFKHLPFTNGHPNADCEIKRPDSFDEMKALAAKLSAGIPQVRVDFYDINGKVYFGELTFAHWSGMVPFEPEEWDKKFGEWIKLPDSIGGGI